MPEDIKQLAVRYFEGVITRDEESALLAYVEQSEENRARFRQCEAEWNAHQSVSLPTRQAWERLQGRLMMLEERPARTVRLWRRVAAAVAVVLLLAGTAAVTWRLAGSRAESYCTLTAPMGSKSRLALPDGSVVWLNAGSTLRYSTLFGHKNRRVELSGEGYFEVAKHNGAEFTVHTSGYDVVVKGTKFDVSAYSDDQFITTSLMEGSVLINHGRDHLMMKPGEMVTLDTATGEFTKTAVTSDGRAWLHNMADFDDITLADLAKILSRQYDVQIHIKSAQAAAVRLSISLRNKETIDEVLDALQKVTGTRVTRHDKDIYISQ
ncbi:FecR family protein [Prevotella sp. kh1p2]|uniref:FecR family protein n=1 Tax=Prevotella sp. kh1p2 TaxID=1761883 RepID=UPI0008B1A64D|nr:FecR domain-containing protein [Prevotella sp. kh1p2]SES84011.1 FecR family protein [Prevotella sp. kh1p2]SNU10778.1 FecR family protein [Prevotellaceae bacterium KH2P17]